MTWRIGAATGCCSEMPIADVVTALAETGIPGLEIGTPPRHFDVWQRSQIDAVRSQLSRLNVTAVAIHAPFGGLLDLSDPNAHHRYAGIGAILTAAAIIRELGGSIAVVHPTDTERGVPDARERLVRCAESLRTLHAACAQIGVMLAIESPLPHLIGGSPEEFDWILKQVGPTARVCLDTGHTTLGGNWDDFVTVAAGRLVHVHAHDHHGRFDDHLPPGEGGLPWAHIAGSLRRSGFEGWMMMELRCPSEPLVGYFRRASSRFVELLATAV